MQTPKTPSTLPRFGEVTRDLLIAITPDITPGIEAIKKTPTTSTAPHLGGTDTPRPRTYTLTRSTLQPRSRKPLSEREKKEIAESGAKQNLEERLTLTNETQNAFLTPQTNKIDKKGKEKISNDDEKLDFSPIEDSAISEIDLESFSINTKIAQSYIDKEQRELINTAIVKTSSYLQDISNIDPKYAEKFPFHEYADGTLNIPKDHQFVLSVDHVESQLLLTTAPISKPTDKESSKEIVSNNRRIYRAFQAFLLSQKQYNPSVIREIWRPDSDIEIAFKAGVPLTCEMIRETICQAEQLQVYYELANERWEISNPPTNGLPSDKAEALKSFFYKQINTARFAQRYEAVVWKPITSDLLTKLHPEAAKSLENKQTIHAFMHFLKEANINSLIVHYIYQKYFDPTLAIKTPSLNRENIARIYQEARSLHYSIDRSLLIERPFILPLLSPNKNQPKKTKPYKKSWITPYTGKWNAFCTRIGLGLTEVIPTTQQMAEEHRTFISNLLSYIASEYGTEIVRVVWPQLELSFKLGIKPSSSQIISLLHQAEIIFSETQNSIHNYVESYLPDLPLVREVYDNIPSFWMQKLRKRLEHVALNQAKKNGGKPLSIKALHAITQKCHARICAEACIYYSSHHPPKHFDLKNGIQWKKEETRRVYRIFRDHLNKERGGLLWTKINASYGDSYKISLITKSEEAYIKAISLRERIESTDIASLLSKQMLNSWTLAQKDNDQQPGRSDEFLENLTLRQAAQRSASKATGSVATVVNSTGMTSEYFSIEQHVSPTRLSDYIFPSTVEPYAAGLGAGAVAALIEGIDYKNTKQLHTRIQTKKDQLRTEYRVKEITRAALEYCLKNYRYKKQLASILNLPINNLPNKKNLQDWINDLDNRMNDIQGALLQNNFDNVDTDYKWQIPTNIVIDILASFSSGNFLLGNLTASLNETASDAFLTVAGGGFFVGGTLSFISNSYAAYDSLKKQRNCKKAKERIETAMWRNLPFAPNGSFKPSDTDFTHQAHKNHLQYKYDAYLLSWRRIESKGHYDQIKIKPGAFISDDPYAAILRSFHDHQKDRDHAFQKWMNGIKALGSAMGAGSVSYLLASKFGVISTATTVTAATTAVGTFAITAAASMGISLILGGTGFLAYWQYRRRKEDANLDHIKHLRQAYRYNHGPYYKRLKKKDLETNEAHLTDKEAQAIAKNKLLQKDLDLSLTIMALDLQKEHDKNDKPNTNKIKHIFRPYEQKDPDDMEPEHLNANYKWDRNIDLLAKLSNPEEIKFHLREMLIPAE